MSLVHKSHATDMQHIEISQNMEVNKLKAQLEELRSYNEKDWVEFHRVQMENEVLRNTIEYHQIHTTIPEVVKKKSLEKNEELQSMCYHHNNF